MAKYILVHGIRVAKDFTPETFGRLTTLGPKFLLPIPDGTYKAYQVCRCGCGEVLVVRTNNLKTNTAASCGCIRRSMTIDRNTTHGFASKSSPFNGTYRIWTGMVARCRYTHYPALKNWGGRGIKVCQRWQTFENFLADMGQRPSPTHSIDRIDVDGDYCPENCRWATRIQQNNNKRNNTLVTAFGKTQSLAEWCRECNMVYGTFARRIRNGADPEQTIAEMAGKTSK